MKRLVSIGLLFLLGFQVAGYFSVFRLMQSGIRKEVFHEIESGIKSDSMVEINIPTDPEQAALLGYTLVRNREIIFRGVYYDIVRSETVGSFTRYFCYADEKETRLVEQMNEAGHQHQQEQVTLVHHLASLSLAVYLAGYEYLPDRERQNGPADKTGYFFSASTWDLSMSVPPPKPIV